MKSNRIIFLYKFSYIYIFFFISFTLNLINLAKIILLYLKNNGNHTFTQMEISYKILQNDKGKYKLNLYFYNITGLFYSGPSLL